MTATSAEPLRVERLLQPSPDDRAAILAIEGTSFSNPWTAEAFDRMLESTASQVWVIRDGSDIVGFCACYVLGDQLDVNTLAVTPARRRQGIARKLLQRMIAETGVRSATLEVRASNIAAIRLYEGLGFRVTHTRPRYYENPEEDGLILWLNP